MNKKIVLTAMLAMALVLSIALVSCGGGSSGGGDQQGGVYTITFNLGGGALTGVTGNTFTKTTGEDGKLAQADIPGNPIKDGVESNGWYTAATAGTKLTLVGYVFTAATTVYAQYGEPSEPTEDAVAVTFDLDGGKTPAGGTAVAAQSVEYGGKVEEPPAPWKHTGADPMVFDGWYDGETKFVFATDVGETTGSAAAVGRTLTLKAKWTTMESAATLSDKKVFFYRYDDASTWKINNNSWASDTTAQAAHAAETAQFAALPGDTWLRMYIVGEGYDDGGQMDSKALKLNDALRFGGKGRDAFDSTAEMPVSLVCAPMNEAQRNFFKAETQSFIDSWASTMQIESENSRYWYFDILKRDLPRPAGDFNVNDFQINYFAVGGWAYCEFYEDGTEDWVDATKWANGDDDYRDDVDDADLVYGPDGTLSWAYGFNIRGHRPALLYVFAEDWEPATRTW